MGITIGVLLVAILGFTGNDIVSSTNYVEAPFRYVCLKTDGEWENKHQPSAACVNQERDLGKPETDV